MLTSLTKKRILLGLSLTTLFTLPVLPAWAITTVTSAEGHLSLHIYNKGETSTYAGNNTSVENLNAWQKAQLLYSLNYWEKIISKSFSGSNPSIIDICSPATGDAAATSLPSLVTTNKGSLLCTNLMSSILQYEDFGTKPSAYIYVAQDTNPITASEQYFYTPVPQLEGGG